MAHSEVLGFVLRTEILCTPFWVIYGFHCMAKMGHDSPRDSSVLWHKREAPSAFCGQLSVLQCSLGHYGNNKSSISLYMFYYIILPS